MTPNIAFYLPRNSDAHEISEWADETPLDENDLTVGGKEWVEVEEEWMGWSKEDPLKATGKNKRRSVGKEGSGWQVEGDHGVLWWAGRAGRGVNAMSY
jgi:hypothetical protein